MARYPGSCHCGAVRFTVEADPVEVAQCDCSLCVKKNARMVRIPAAALTLTAGEAELVTYRWNTGVARHHFCRVCGIYVFHYRRADPTTCGVNVYCLEGFDPDGLPLIQVDGRTMSLVAP